MRVSTYGKGRAALEMALARREPFKTSGALHAVNYAPWTTGQLPNEWAEEYRLDTRRPGIDYVVYSYDTPIAWVSRDGDVVIPPVTYSRTTSNHQSIVRTHLRQARRRAA